VGTVIFDPDGEYYWPDDKNRPGLCDVVELENKIVVFTKKKGPSPFYQSFVANDIKLDIRRLRPSEVISIALSPEKQEQQNVRKLKGLNDSDWRKLVDEIFLNKNAADPDLIKKLLKLEPSQDVEMVAARGNMTNIVKMLHDPASQMMDMLIYSLKHGKICIIDVSQMRGEPALILSSLVLQKIFDHNQQQFTEAKPETIPTIAVVEEAQAVLGNSGRSGERPYVTWVKEGRKYDLGAVLITQQPGSISKEILSQGDNWFVFHLLSEGDLKALKYANAHFSDDLLRSLLNEPIVGHSIFWSSVSEKSYPIPIRILSFEELYQTRDSGYCMGKGNTFALELIELFKSAVLGDRGKKVGFGEKGVISPEGLDALSGENGDEGEDVLERYISSAIEIFKNNILLISRLKQKGLPWREVITVLENALPDVIDAQDRNKVAHSIVPRALNEVFSNDEEGWDTEKRPRKEGSGTTTWIVINKKE